MKEGKFGSKMDGKKIWEAKEEKIWRAKRKEWGKKIGKFVKQEERWKKKNAPDQLELDYETLR